MVSIWVDGVPIGSADASTCDTPGRSVSTFSAAAASLLDMVATFLSEPGTLVQPDLLDLGAEAFVNSLRRIYLKARFGQLSAS